MFVYIQETCFSTTWLYYCTVQCLFKFRKPVSPPRGYTTVLYSNCLHSGNLFLHHVALLSADNCAGFAREFQLLKDKTPDGKYLPPIFSKMRMEEFSIFCCKIWLSPFRDKFDECILLYPTDRLNPLIKATVIYRAGHAPHFLLHVGAAASYPLSLRATASPHPISDPPSCAMVLASLSASFIFTF